MTATNDMETNVLLLYFNNTDHALVGDTAGLQASAAPGSLYISLHTANPGETGDQTTSEIAYTGYARVAVARSGAGWTVAGSNVSNAALVTFGEMTGGAGGTVTYFGIGTDSTGVGELLFFATATPNLSVVNGIIPEFAIGDLDVDVD
jgi:hypothetical protein